MFPLKDNIPTDRTPILTIAFIAINVVVYFLLQKGGIFSGPDDAIVVDWGAIPYEFSHPGDDCAIAGQQILCEGMSGVEGAAPDQPPFWVTAFSSMFMHGSVLHLGGNMLFLWIFGNNVEDSMGHVKFLAFYVLGGLAAIARPDHRRAERRDPDDRRVGRRRRGARRLHPALSAGARRDGDLHHLLLHDHRAAGDADPRLLVRAAGRVRRLRRRQPDRRRGRRRVLRAHRRLRSSGWLAIKLFASRTKDYSPPPKYPVY